MPTCLRHRMPKKRQFGFFSKTSEEEKTARGASSSFFFLFSAADTHTLNESTPPMAI
jgi:hypothetical protein